MTGTIAAVAILSTLTIRAEAAAQKHQQSAGGKIICGQVPGETTEAGAIRHPLRVPHTQWGPPAGGQIFRS